jgi:hypothetical protein
LKGSELYVYRAGSITACYKNKVTREVLTTANKILILWEVVSDWVAEEVARLYL